MNRAPKSHYGIVTTGPRETTQKTSKEEGLPEAIKKTWLCIQLAGKREKWVAKYFKKS